MGKGTRTMGEGAITSKSSRATSLNPPGSPRPRLLNPRTRTRLVPTNELPTLQLPAAKVPAPSLARTKESDAGSKSRSTWNPATPFPSSSVSGMLIDAPGFPAATPAHNCRV
jgi:hypothetical protein